MLYCLENWCSWLKLEIGMMFGMIGMFIFSLCIVFMKWK